MRRLTGNLIVYALVALAALALRSVVLTIYTIPSPSMLPRLLVGDYLLVEKWPYGWSRVSLPGWLPSIRGRLAEALPERGDIVVFRAPPAGKLDYVKRVIGLPGDRVALRGGRLILNGRRVPRWRVADLLVPLSPNSPCATAASRDPDGRPACRYRRYREQLPGGASWDVIDGGRSALDDFGPVTVPVDRLFLLGDHRDASADSRLPAGRSGGVGPVPVANLVGRAGVILFSTDGSAPWSDPSSWRRAARIDRIGEGF